MFETIALLLFVLPLPFSVVALAAMHWFPWHNGTRQLGYRMRHTASDNASDELLQCHF